MNLFIARSREKQQDAVITNQISFGCISGDITGSLVISHVRFTYAHTYTQWYMPSNDHSSSHLLINCAQWAQHLVNCCADWLAFCCWNVCFFANLPEDFFCFCGFSCLHWKKHSPSINWEDYRRRKRILMFDTEWCFEFLRISCVHRCACVSFQFWSHSEHLSRFASLRTSFVLKALSCLNELIVKVHMLNKQSQTN